MKVAAISDVHGNIAALEAVLVHAAARRVDLKVNLGDICSGGLFPRETADRLLPMELPTIRGNHERQLADLPAERMGLSDSHAFERLRADQRAWLAALPSTLRVLDDLMLVHGTPESDLDYLLDTVTADGLRTATPAEVARRAGGTDAAVILCGHSHLQGVMVLEDGRTIVNPGSVGLPAYDDDHPHPHVVESGTPHARYAIVSNEGDGWSVEHLQVDYDWEQAALHALAHGRPDWARALRTGRI